MAEMDDDFTFDTDKAVALPDTKNPVRPENAMAHFVMERFQKAEDARRPVEDRWLRAWANIVGNYGADVAFTESERSKVFVKVTKTKVLAAYGQIVEVLFGSNRFPLSVRETVLPDGVRDKVSFDPAAPPGLPKPKPAPVSPFGTRDGPPLPPGATAHTLELGPLAQQLEPVRDKLVPGPGTTPTAVTFSPAEIAAKKMEKKIHDQLEEGGASKHLRSVAYECAALGTGILKGPFVIDKEYPRWKEDGSYDPLLKVVPSTSHVSVWNAYPDPHAYNMEEAEYFVERHKLSRSGLRDLSSRPMFLDEAIDRAIEAGPNYEPKHWESQINGTSVSDVERYEALEFWGFVATKDLKQYGMTIPQELSDKKEISVNIWVCNNEILRLVMNPFKPAHIPYHAVPYELNPYSFFGTGVAENMEDTQLLMNGFMRLAVDNAVLSGNLIIEVNEDMLVPGQDMTVYPGKIFKRQGGAPGQAIFGTEFPNVSQQNMMLFEKARQLSDESTGIPSFSHGQTGVTGVGRTASGISMLMNAANGSTRTVIKNFDDYLLAPLGKAFFSWNMQFDHDPEIKGDLEVFARGTESLMATEVRSQRLMQFLQVVSNPMLAPFAKLDMLVREIAKSLDLDPETVTNSLPDAAIQAELLKAFATPPPDPNAPQSPGAPAPQGLSLEGGPGSGGGQMGTGGAPTPGEAGFSANTGEGAPQ